MSEVKIKTRGAALFHLLSEIAYSELLNISRRMLKFLLSLARGLHVQYCFLRNFDYSKGNVHQHLINKASLFFGIEWEEDGMKEKVKNKRFGQRMKERLNRKRTTKRCKVSELSEPMCEKTKKKSKNFYRAPE